MHAFSFAGETVHALPQALWWPRERALFVADLHLEKASWYALGGQLLPPYDTIATLDRLTRLATDLGAQAIYCLGDSFHDVGADARLSPDARERIAVLAQGARLVWLAGNHDPVPADVPGERYDELHLGPFILRHEARRGAVGGELSGHYHPCLRLRVRSHFVRRPCFIHAGGQLILPAFGALTGGLCASDAVYGALFPGGHDALVASGSRLNRFAFRPAANDGDARMALPLA